MVPSSNCYIYKQPLHLRLRDHYRRGSRKMRIARGQKPLLWDSIFSIWQANFMWFLKASPPKKKNKNKKTLQEKKCLNTLPFLKWVLHAFQKHQFTYSLHIFIKCVGRNNQLSFQKWSNHVTICFCPLWHYPCGAHWPDIQMSAFASLPTAFPCYRLFIPREQQATWAFKSPVP